MTFARLHKWVTYLFAVLGFAALALGAELGPARVSVIVACVIATWFVEAPLLHRPGWGRIWNVASVVVFGAQMARWFAGGSGFTLGIEYAAFLQLTRLADRRTATEHLHVVGLAFLHLIIGTVLTTGLDYAAVFLGFVVVTPWMLALTHLRGEIERQYAEEGSPVGVPTERAVRALDSRGLAGRGFLVGSSLLSVPLFLVTAAFFLLFPRVGMGFLTFRGARGESVAGFGNEVELGDFGTIRDDPTVVVRVFPADAPADPPLEVSLRLRGTSFDRYDGMRWTRGDAGPPRVLRHHGSYPLFDRPIGSARRGIRIVVDPLDDPVFFLPEGTVALSLPPRVVAGVEQARAITIRDGLDVRLAVPDGTDLDYVAEVEPGIEGWPESLDEDQQKRLVSLPPGSERIAAYARTVVGDAHAPTEIARLVLAELRDSGRYRYSLELRDPGRRNPLEFFLFESRSGHCEFYSTAMAVMLRSQGIPTRNVTGYLGGRWNSYGRYYALRQGDAHSWVEAWIDGQWRTFDPTPPARDALRPSSTPLSVLREMLDALRTRWASDVVGYDMRSQIGLFLQLRNAWRALRGHGSGFGGGESTATQGASRRIGTGAVALVLGGALVGLLVVGLLFWVDQRRRRVEVPVAPETLLYRRLEAVLARRGAARPVDRTPLEHLAHLERERFPGLFLVREITEAYARSRYAEEPLPEARLAELEGKLRELARMPAAQRRK